LEELPLLARRYMTACEASRVGAMIAGEAAIAVCLVKIRMFPPDSNGMVSALAMDQTANMIIPKVNEDVVLSKIQVERITSVVILPQQSRPPIWKDSAGKHVPRNF
jgi:hypothetical protein